MEVFFKEGALTNFAGVAGTYLFRIFIYLSRKLKSCKVIKKEIPAQEFSCEFCKVSKNTFLTEHLQKTVFVLYQFCSMD